MEIGHIIGKMSRDGAETFLMNVFREIDRNNYKFNFIVHSSKEESYDREIKILNGKLIKVCRKKDNILKNIFQTFKALRGMDVVHIHTNSAISVIDLVCAYFARVRIRIIHSHSSNILSKKQLIIHKLLKNLIPFFATDYLSCSKEAANHMFTKKLLRNKKVIIIENGINLKKFIYKEKERNEKRKELNIKNEYILGHIGRFSLVKNHIFLLEILKKCKEENLKVKLVLVGKGELFEKIILKAKEYNILEMIIFLGEIDDVNKTIQAFDLFLLPSYFEGLPLVLLESQISGLDCLASDKITKEAEIVNKSVTFLSINENNEKLWVEEIKRKMLIKKNRKLEENIIEENKYSIIKVVEKLKRIYDE